MSMKNALLPTPATSPDRGTQTLICASRSDLLAPAIEVAAPIAVAVTNTPAINLRVMFMLLLLGAIVGGFHEHLRRPRTIGSHQLVTASAASGNVRPASREFTSGVMSGTQLRRSALSRRAEAGRARFR